MLCHKSCLFSRKQASDASSGSDLFSRFFIGMDYISCRDSEFLREYIDAVLQIRQVGKDFR